MGIQIRLLYSRAVGSLFEKLLNYKTNSFNIRTLWLPPFALEKHKQYSKQTWLQRKIQYIFTECISLD